MDSNLALPHGLNHSISHTVLEAARAAPALAATGGKTVPESGLRLTTAHPFLVMHGTSSSVDLSVEELRFAQMLDSWNVPTDCGGLSAATRIAVRSAGVSHHRIGVLSAAAAAPGNGEPAITDAAALQNNSCCALTDACGADKQAEAAAAGTVGGVTLHVLDPWLSAMSKILA